MTTTPPKRRAGAEPDPEAIALLRAAIEAGEIDPLAPMVPEHLAGMLPGYEPVPKRKPAPKRKPPRRQRKGRTATRRIIAEGRAEPVKRKHGGGHPRASPEATRAVLEAGDARKNVQEMAAAGGVSWATARRIWDRERGELPPPGLGRGFGGPHGGGRPATVTPAQARKAIEMRGKRTPGGGWETSIPKVAAELEVSVKALRRAIEKEEKRSEKEQP